jgi:hypothetical protein
MTNASPPLHAAHALAFVRPEIELAAIGGGRQIGLVERHAGAVQEDLATYSTQSGAKRPVDRDSIGPGFRVMVTHTAPARVVMERAAHAGALFGGSG